MRERWKCKHAHYLGTGCDIDFYECALSGECCDGVCDKYKEIAPKQIEKMLKQYRSK